MEDLSGGQALEKYEKAHKMVSDLNHKRRQWLMSIPADPAYDCDLVICAALDLIPDLITARDAWKAKAERLDTGPYGYQVSMRAHAEQDAARLAELLKRLDLWIFQRGFESRDHACAECYPGGELTGQGFVCARHAIREVLAAHDNLKGAL